MSDNDVSIACQITNPDFKWKKRDREREATIGNLVQKGLAADEKLLRVPCPI